MSREFFHPHALEVAPQLLGAVLTVESDLGPVSIRVTEVEAYHGVGVPGVYDGGSHARSRKTERNASMFGPPGHIYVYLSYGVHYAVNMVCSPEGVASGVLIRSGEVIEGVEIAQQRRFMKRGGVSVPVEGPSSDLVLPHSSLARGPGNLATALGITRAEHDGLDLFAHPLKFDLSDEPVQHQLSGPRVGVSGEAGGHGYPWRFWVAHDPTVSRYRPGKNVPGSIAPAAR